MHGNILYGTREAPPLGLGLLLSEVRTENPKGYGRDARWRRVGPNKMEA